RRATTPLRTLARAHVMFFFASRRRHTILVSDWSSDVCSSDLSASAPETPPPACPRARCAGRAPRPVREPRFGARSPQARASIDQIGRASCRERVESSGGGAVLKEKRERRAWGQGSATKGRASG